MGSATGVTWQRVWRNGQRTIRLGEHPDGRWLVQDVRGRLHEHWEERSACDRIQRAMGRTRWVELELHASSS